MSPELTNSRNSPSELPFGLKDESPPPHVIPTEVEGSGRESFAVRRSFRVPHSEFRAGSSLKPAVEADGSGGRKCLSPEMPLKK
jgi:hypothetical protein